MTTNEQLIENLKEYNSYLIKAIQSESILRDITLGAREKYESEIAQIEAEIAKEAKVIFKEPEHDEQTAEKLRQALDLASVKASKKKEPEGVTAVKSIADCLSEAGFSCHHLDLNEHPLLEKGIKLYADQFIQADAAIKQPGLRDELIKFIINEVDRGTEQVFKHTKEEAENWVDEYLKQSKSK